MAKLTRNQVLAICYAQGFRGQALALAVAIAGGESGWVTDATHNNSDGSVDRGLFQINSVHSQYSAAGLFDPVYNTMAAWNISKRGTSWTPWVAYTNGRYRQFYQESDARYQGVPSNVPTNPATPDFNQGQPKRGVEAVRSFICPGSTFISGWGADRASGPHEGEDLQNTMRARTFFPENGTVFDPYGGSFYNSLGGYCVHLRGDSGLTWYFCHFDSKPNLRDGQKVTAGQYIAPVGMSGNAKGTVPHLHYQVGPKGIWGNPVSVLADFVVYGSNVVGPIDGGSTGFSPVDGGTAATTYGAISDSIHQTLVEMPGFAGIALALDQAEGFFGFPPYAGGTLDVGALIQYGLNLVVGNAIPFFTRSFFYLIGMLLFIALIWNFLRQQASELAPIIGRAAIGAAVPA